MTYGLPAHNRESSPFRTLMDEPIEIDGDPLSGFDTLLQAALDNETRTPQAILDFIPSPTIPVSSLLEKKLPALLYRSAINLRPVELCMTDSAARWTIEELFEAPIPPREWLSKLEISLEKKWLTRARVNSIRHPTVSGLHLPLWAGNFWYSVVGAAEQKEEWRRAERWISGKVQDVGVYEARKLMGRIPWGMKIWALAGMDSLSAIGVLAGLLSSDWVAERHLDTLASHLNFCVSRGRKGGEGCWVGDVYFSTCFKRIHRATKKSIRDDWDLKKYQKTVTGHGYKRLLFPANLGGEHWIVFSVDLVKNEFCYGKPPHFSERG